METILMYQQYELFPNTPQLYYQLPKCRVNSECTTSDSAISEPSTSYYSDDNEDKYSELSDFDPCATDCEDIIEEPEKSLEEVQEEVDELFERIFKKLDDMDASIEGIKVELQ